MLAEHARKLEAQRAAAIRRAEKAERERDEARRHATIGVPGPHHLKGDTLKRARIVANRYWPGQGDHLFPEES